MSELKPCPFCGREPITRISFRCSPAGAVKASVDVYIKCPKCHCTRNVVLELCDTTFEQANTAMQNAIEAWNRRYEPVAEIDYDYEAEDG